MNTPTPKTSPDAALGNLMAAALDVPAASEQPAVPDDTLARTGNTADHQAGWFAGMEQGQANAQDNAAVRAGASTPKHGDALSLEAVDAAVAAWFASVPTASLQNDTTAHFRERMSAALRAAQVAAQPWPEAGAAQVAAYTLPDGIRVVRTSQMDGTHLWAVRRNGDCLGRDGAWSYEPMPSNRNDAWLALHRFATASAAIGAAIAAQQGKGGAR
ncbi:hypothetical protein ACH58_07595 [Achromobacter xylosoxidans]|uniref:hypothetical protein n=1 Tax=Alcaligenes xylosoxydans xylosoxydans TaxID=85698 RepID=UPI00064E0053|nr:hypothetical protein [Achromobacter xylosoxidans]KMJ92480.1 hypothetical protein ACH58_07595 [Achromobacter xylosoxidans]